MSRKVMIPVRLNPYAVRALNEAARELGVSREAVVRALLSKATPGAKDGRDVAKAVKPWVKTA